MPRRNKYNIRSNPWTKRIGPTRMEKSTSPRRYYNFIKYLPRSPPTTLPETLDPARMEANVIAGVVIVAIIVMVAGDRRHPANGRASKISPFNDSPDQQAVCFLNDTKGSRNRGNI